MEYKVCSLDYFLDKMQDYELSIILESLPYSTKLNWELTRLLGYIIAQTLSTKHLKPTDILSFSWDKEDKKDTSMSKEDVERLTNKMNEIINKNKN